MRDKKLTNAGKIFLLLSLICVVFLISFFLYHSVRFNKKVEIFNNEIIIGIKEEDVVNLMGVPDYRGFAGYNKKLIEIRGEKSSIECYEFVYSGKFAMRGDLCLYFDGKTKTLILKEKGGTVIPEY
jgi:hypothetical protein